MFISFLFKLIIFNIPYKGEIMAKRILDLKFKDFPKEKHQLIRAILNNGGSVRNFAKELGVNPNLVYVWLNQPSLVPPAQYCKQIEKITHGEVTCEQLRPDVYGSTLIEEETIENKFKRAIGMMKELEVLWVDKGRLTPFKKPKKRG